MPLLTLSARCGGTRPDVVPATNHYTVDRIKDFGCKFTLRQRGAAPYAASKSYIPGPGAYNIADSPRGAITISSRFKMKSMSKPN